MVCENAEFCVMRLSVCDPNEIAALTVTLCAKSLMLPAASVKRSVKEYTAAVVGVPLSNDVLLASVSPAGRVPPARENT